MDGILSAINSVIPIVPGNNTMTDKGNIKGPPVEIAPIPDNSFMSNDVASQALKNAYTLSLDIKGYDNETASTGQHTGAAKSALANQAALAETTHGANLDEAFTLTLGSGEEAQLTSENMREMLRLRNYEQLGKMGGRKFAGRYPERPAGEAKEPQANQTAATRGRVDAGTSGNIASGQLSALETELLDRILTQSEEIPQPVQPGTQHEENEQAAPLPERSEELLHKMQQRGLHPEEELPPRSAVPNAGLKEAAAQPQGLIDSGKLQQTIVNNPLLTGTMEEEMNVPALTAATLSAPDELQTEKLAASQIRMTEGKFNLSLFDNKIQNYIESPFNISNSTPERVGRLQYSTAVELPDQQLGDLRAAALFDSELSQITGGVFTGARASGSLQSAAGGSMLNLRKITELPYSLYIFGHVNEKVRGNVLDEDNDTVIQEETKRKQDQSQAKFLRISEAIKMAAILHHIYYGGDGRFEDESPWYWPYVSYALKYGIIQVNDFSDFNSLATKAETAYIFSRSVPDAEFIVFNYIPYLPDVTEDGDLSERIYLLFRAGVLTGSDSSGRFYPDRLMTRTEAAAIIGRIATPKDRKGFTF